MLLKLATVCWYSKSVVFSEIRARQVVKDLEEKVILLQSENVVMDKAKQDLSSEVEGLKQQVKTKDCLLEELKG